MRHRFVAALVALAAACRAEEAEEGPVELLPPREQLLRLSMDLRGVHPTEAELWRYERADPEVRPALFQDHALTWIEDPRFAGRLKEIFDQRFLFRTGEVYFDPAEAGLGEVDPRVLADTLAQEPLNLLQYVVENDLPYRELVTADHTMANELLARYWGIDLPEDSGGAWVPSRYSDGRPHAGVLSMSTTWQRYPSMGGNANRHRANAISKMFLCDDYLSRPIVLNRAAVDQLTVDPENAIAQNVGCQSCHASLDPMAANLFGFFHNEPEDGLASTRYRPENEEEWRYYSGKEPAYFGRPTANLQEFARALAEDSRFADCAVRTVWEGLTQRELADEDWGEVAPVSQAFADSDQDVKEAFLAVVGSEPYLGSAALDPELEERFVGRKVVSPAQLSSLVHDLTGYTWTFDGRDGLRDHQLGLPVLAGGIDGRYVTRRSYVPTVGLVYVQERLATAAAHHVAAHDLDPERTDDARLLIYVTLLDTPESDPAAFDGQIRHLYQAILGIPLAPDAPEPDRLVALWRSLHSVEASPTSAWAGVISAVLRDPRVLFY